MTLKLELLKSLSYSFDLCDSLKPGDHELLEVDLFEVVELGWSRQAHCSDFFDEAELLSWLDLFEDDFEENLVDILDWGG